MKHMAVLGAGLVGGYIVTVAQLTEGLGYQLRAYRTLWENVCGDVSRKYRDKARTLPDDSRERGRLLQRALQAESCRELTVCGWCLSPWVTVPLAVVSQLASGERNPLRLMAGAAVATAVAAGYRHVAELA